MVDDMASTGGVRARGGVGRGLLARLPLARWLLVCLPLVMAAGAAVPGAAWPGTFVQLDPLAGLGAERAEFLHPDVAYVLSVRTSDPHTVVVRFDIADEYYLYRDKLSFEASGAPGVTVARVELPPGEEKVDEFFGRMQVFYHEVEAVLALERSDPRAAEIALTVGYQGCADAGLCYPPMTQTVPLALPETGTGEGGISGSRASLALAVAPAAERPEQDRIARSRAGRPPSCCSPASASGRCSPSRAACFR